jgi:arylsulfatase
MFCIRQRSNSPKPIDGIDQSAFLLGDQETSNREHVLIYIGDELFSVKWRTFKIHVKTVENLWAPIQTHQFPPVYDIANDPGEDNNLMKLSLFAYSWVYGPMGQILQEKAATMQQYPNIKPGQDFESYK